MSDKKTIWCRNCHEFAPHEKIGVRQAGWTKPPEGRKPWARWLYEHLKFEPVYACCICRCKTTDRKN